MHLHLCSAVECHTTSLACPFHKCETYCTCVKFPEGFCLLNKVGNAIGRDRTFPAAHGIIVGCHGWVFVNVFCSHSQIYTTISLYMMLVSGNHMTWTGFSLNHLWASDCKSMHCGETLCHLAVGGKLVRCMTKGHLEKSFIMVWKVYWIWKS